MSETPRGAAWSAAWGVVAVVLGSGAVAAWMAAVAPGSKFPAWPAWMLGATTVVAVYMSFAFLSGRWPVNRSPGRDRRARLTQPQGSEVDLISEQAGERLRLGLVNHGSPAEYFAEVTGILDPLRRKIGPQHWPIPWLEDGSAGPKRIHSGQTRMLDFALYQEADVKAELNAGNGGTAHWRFHRCPSRSTHSITICATRRTLTSNASS